MPFSPAEVKPDSAEARGNAVSFADAIVHGDALKLLPELPAGHVDLTVFSPPYDGIRDYGKNWRLDRMMLGAPRGERRNA